MEMEEINNWTADFSQLIHINEAQLLPSGFSQAVGQSDLQKTRN